MLAFLQVCQNIKLTKQQIMIQLDQENSFIPDNISTISSKNEYNAFNSQQAVESLDASQSSKHTLQHFIGDNKQSASNYLAKSKEKSKNKHKVRFNTLHSSRQNNLQQHKQIERKQKQQLGLQQKQKQKVLAHYNQKIKNKGRQKLYKQSSYKNDLVSLNYDNKYRETPETDGTSLYHLKNNETQVISEKQSVVQAEDSSQQIDESIGQIHPQAEQEKLQNQNMLITDEKNDRIELQQGQHYEQQRMYYYQPYNNNTSKFIKTIVKFEQQPEIDWLQHRVSSNTKFLISQTSQLTDYNRAVYIELEKMDLRKKIIQMQIQTNNLKISLRKSKSTKHINFCSDFKYKREIFLKIPKVIDTDLRNYLKKLEKKVQVIRNQSECKQKQFKLLEFYQKQFSQKINRAYIYQQYLIELQEKSSKKSKNNISSKSTSQYDKKQSIQVNNEKNNKKLRSKNKIDVNQSCTSLERRLSKRQQYQSPTNKNKNYKCKTNHKHSTSSQYLLFSNEGSLSLSDEKSPYNNNNNENTYFQWNFNSLNRNKKYFYYQCQQYLKELDEQFFKRQLRLCGPNVTETMKNMQVLYSKNNNLKEEILQVQVDVQKRIKQLKSQNDIIKAQIQQIEILLHQTCNKGVLRDNQYQICTKPIPKAQKQKLNRKQEYLSIVKSIEQQKLKTLGSSNFKQQIKNRSQKSQSRSMKTLKRYGSLKKMDSKTKQKHIHSNKYLNRFNTTIKNNKDSDRTVKQISKDYSNPEFEKVKNTMNMMLSKDQFFGLDIE